MLNASILVSHSMVTLNETLNMYFTTDFMLTLLMLYQLWGTQSTFPCWSSYFIQCQEHKIETAIWTRVLVCLKPLGQYFMNNYLCLPSKGYWVDKMHVRHANISKSTKWPWRSRSRIILNKDNQFNMIHYWSEFGSADLSRTYCADKGMWGDMLVGKITKCPWNKMSL